jgi:hypothetical protein
MGCWEVSGFRGQQARRRDQISHFKRDVRNLPDEIGDRRVGFEAHPLDAKFAFLMADDKEFQVFQVGLARLRLSSGNSDVMVPAHCLSLSVKLTKILRCRRSVRNRALVAGFLRHDSQLFAQETRTPFFLCLNCTDVPSSA